MNKRLKGISPLVAVIMLIAFTMIVAGILAGWATRFTTEQTAQLKLCAKASIWIVGGDYSNGTLNLSVYNKGDFPLSSFDISLTYINGSVSVKSDATNITAHSTGILSISTSSDLQSVSVASQECPGAYDAITRYDKIIRGL